MTVRHLHTASLTRDPGYLPAHAWRDSEGYDREQDSRWDEVAPGIIHPTTPPDGLPPIGVAPEEFLPTGSVNPVQHPGTAVRGVDSPLRVAGSPSPAARSSS